jgi:hypothetical protein
MTDPVESLPPPVRRRRRWPLVLVPLALAAAAWLYLYFAGDQRLARAVAEADRLDPHWRLDDLLAERAAVPDEENAALTVIAAKKKRPPKWPAWDFAVVPAGPAAPPGDSAAPPEPSLQEVLTDLKPNEALTDKEKALVRAELERAADALREARKLVDQPRGRYPIVYTQDWIGTLLTGIQDTRETAYLLSIDALSRSQDGDLDGALVSCRALVNAARSIGDEPGLIPQLVRAAIRCFAAGATERALGQGEPSDGDLAALQKALEEEAEEPLFLFCVRGERAGVDRFMQFVQDAPTTRQHLTMMTALAGASRSAKPRLWEQGMLYLPGSVTTSRAALLERLNQAVEIAKLPREERVARVEELCASLPKEPLLVRELLPSIEKVEMADRRSQAWLRCAATALAVERYRRRHGRWPESLAELKDEFLREVPLDPFDGQPLRYRKDGAGVIVYAVGADGKDDGGDRTTLNTHKDGTDLGTRLWDVPRRRQVRK